MGRCGDWLLIVYPSSVLDFLFEFQLHVELLKKNHMYSLVHKSANKWAKFLKITLICSSYVWQ